MFIANGNAKRYSIGENEGINGLRYRSANDPRVPNVRLNVGNPPAPNTGFDASTPQFDQLRFPDRKTSIPLATGTEARLIEAENALQLGDTVTNAGVFYQRLDSLRAHPPGYWWLNPSIAAPTSMTFVTTDSATAQGGAVNLLMRERAFWMWMSAHRLADLRRLARLPYNRPAESVFPTGAYFKGGLYGTDYNFPVPFEETNNPNFTQCLDRLP